MFAECLFGSVQILSRISVRNRRDINVFCVFKLFDLPSSHFVSGLNGHIFNGFLTVSPILVGAWLAPNAFLASIGAFLSLQLRIFLLHVPHRSTIAPFLPHSTFSVFGSRKVPVGLRAVVLISVSAAIFIPFVRIKSVCIVLIWSQYCF